MTRLITIVTTLLLVAPSALQADERWTPAMAAKVDAVFERMDKATSPGCAVAVVRDGRTVYTRGYGMANLDHEIVITPSSVFHVASVSKQFAAAAIALLATDGKLSLDDDVRKYLPELQDFGHKITIRHLVHHTSGLRDQWELLGLAGWRYSLDRITDEDVLQLMESQKDLNFPPGDRHLYCNTGYTLLATIVKRVSGQSFRDFTVSRIFQPLGMKSTHFRDDHAEIVKNHAYGYVPAGATFRQSPTNFDTAGATSLLTTVEDLALWDRNFYDGRVGGPGFLDQMLMRGVLNNGETINYAFGLTHGTYRGLPTVGHGGSDAGYRADFLRFPDERFSIVTLCNLSTAGPGDLSRRIADIVLEDRLAPEESRTDDRPAAKLSEKELLPYAGLYWNRDTDAFRRFFVKDGILLVGFGDRGTALKPLGGGRFAMPAADLVFDGADASSRQNPASRPARVTESARSGRGKPVVYEAVEEFKPSASELSEYAGVYRSEEIEPVWRMAVEDGKLVLRRLKFQPTTLEPLVRDVFRAPNATLQFSRDAEGRISGYVWNGGRIRGFRFHKAEATGQGGTRQD
jgi:CubicO group peptidase (beta-lactamase class C family)